jgi:hypothetical protein
VTERKETPEIRIKREREINKLTVSFKKKVYHRKIQHYVSQLV